MGIVAMEANAMTESSPFVRIVYILETDIFLVLEEPIELRMVPVELEFRQNKTHIGPNEGAVP